MIVSKTRNANGWATKGEILIPNGMKCNENVIGYQFWDYLHASVVLKAKPLFIKNVYYCLLKSDCERNITAKNWCSL